MINKKFIKNQYLKEWEYYKENNSVNYTQTPLFFKIYKDLSKDEFEKYIKNFYNFIKEDNIFGYNILDKMFNFREIELFEIKYNNKIYYQKDYKSAITWVNNFLQDNNFTIKELLDFNKDEDTEVFSLKFVKNYSELSINEEIIYFQHRNWGVDQMTKDKSNHNTQTKGWGKLKKKLEKLNSNIIFKPNGSQILKSLGSIRDSQYYPNI